MRITLAASLIALAAPALADVPQVVTDIAPVHSLVSEVMEGVGTPALLIEPGVSPHNYAMRPSEAKMLSEADVVFWVGEAYTPWLEKTLATLAPQADHVELLELPDTILLPVREGEGFEPHLHGLEEGGQQQPEAEHADHEDHDHAGHEAHADHETRDHELDEIDPHAWLDPRNAQSWLRSIAETLSDLDPANAVAYRANAEKAAERLATLDVTIAVRLKDTPGGFITFHDAYQYFENRFGMHAKGALSASDAVEPGPARIAALRDLVREEGVTCLFTEPQFNPRQVATLAGDLNLRTGTLDPIGAQLDPGPDLYFRLVTGIADALMVCLNER